MYTRPLNPRVGPQRTDDRRSRLAQQLLQQRAGRKVGFPAGKVPAMHRGARERFGGLGFMPKSLGGTRPFQGGMPGARHFLPMPQFDGGPGQAGQYSPVFGGGAGAGYGLAPVEPGLPGAAPDFVQQVQDLHVGQAPSMRPDASGPINWGALGIPDPAGPAQSPVGPYMPPPTGTQTMNTAGMQQAIAMGVGQQPTMAGNLIPLGGGQYLDPSTGVVHGVGGLGMM